MSQKKKKVQDEAPRYNLKLPSSKTKKKKNLSLSLSICTPPLCDELLKGNQDSSSKEGGGGDHLKLAKSVRKA